MKLLNIRFLIFLLALGILQISCSKKFNKLQKKGTLDEKYNAAIKYYQEADYYKAGVLLEEITPLLKGDSTSEKAQFYNAYCNYYQSNFQMSSYLFESSKQSLSFPRRQRPHYDRPSENGKLP